MKKTILALTITVLSFPAVVSAHPALSQFPTSTGRPPISEPTQPAVGFSGFQSERTGCQHTWEKNGVLEYTPCHWDIMLAMIQLANLK